MNNYVCTAATSARLKAAGFPQPKPASGQHWYKYDVLLYVHCGDHRGAVCVPVNEDYTSTRVFSNEDAVFAPGVADLLRELGLEYDISTIGDQYIVIRRNEKDEILKDWVNDNPGEALAAAWLELHESDLKTKPDWPQDRFGEYFQAAKSQLGELWTLSDDATTAICGNLQLLWAPKLWTWILESDGVEIGRFVLPFEGGSFVRFQRLCSNHYRSE